eukprot:GGOE01019812.1.p1 GENE.GGOE01019812.1~~GGOE01019812.1.p1  ORF type:complete len:377 (+),score=120.88 GGOE01019812.1:30-1133(+)
MASRPFVAALVSILLGGPVAALWLWRRRHRQPQRLEALEDLRDFMVEEVISAQVPIVLLGRFPWQADGQRAVVKVQTQALERPEVVVDVLRMCLKSYSGAEYCYFDGRPSLAALLRCPEARRAYTLEVIAPASQRQIARCRPSLFRMVEETPEMYTAVVKPFIQQQVGDSASLSWLYNVLELKKEQERLLYHDPDPETGFVLNVDTKWQSHPDCRAVPRDQWHQHPSVKWLYCLAICNRRDLLTLRDLQGEHLPLLRGILDKGRQTIAEVYGLMADQLRVFVHYQPQFYHFHVHFTSLYTEAGVQVERAHLLQDVIRHLEADGQYYQRCTLHHKLADTDPLLCRLTQSEKLDDGALSMNQGLRLKKL